MFIIIKRIILFPKIIGEGIALRVKLSAFGDIILPGIFAGVDVNQAIGAAVVLKTDNGTDGQESAATGQDVVFLIIAVFQPDA